MLRRLFVPVHAREEQLRCRPSDRRGILRDDRHRRVEEIGQQNLVEADECNSMLGLHLFERPDGADRDQILPCEDRRRRMRKS